MLRKLMVAGAVLALLVVSSVPALAQLLTNEPGATGNAPVSPDAVSPDVDIPFDLAPVGEDNPPGPMQYSTVETVPLVLCEQLPPPAS